MADRIILACDGACRGSRKGANLGGFGVVLQYGDSVKEFKGAVPSTTNQQMEILAAIIGLEAVKKDVPVEIVSHSAYLVNCVIQKWYENWRRNGWKTPNEKPVQSIDLWTRFLVGMERLSSVTATHVKGHTGHPLNERCNQLANEAMDEYLKNSKK